MFTRTMRRPRTLAAVAALAVSAVLSIAPAHTQTTPAHAHTTPAKPTIVLVHGAFADGSGFGSVIHRLEHDGYSVRSAPNPLVDLQYDAATVRGFLDSIDGPKVVVGHSYGGAVITQAASGDPDVKALVYLAALAPERGEVLGELVETPVAHPVPPMPLIPVTAQQPDGTTRTDYYLDPAEFRARFAADVSRSVAADLAATQRPLGAGAFTDKVTVQPAWKTIPSWYLVSKQDQAMSPDLERIMADRMHAHTSQINSSHAVYISHPAAVADLVERAARATR